MIITLSDAWNTTYPDAHLGALAMSGARNPRQHATLEQRKRELETQLRARFAGQSKAELSALPVMSAYRAYYERFKKTYHVLLQLRSVAVQGKPLPSVAALVETQFMAELKNGLLTAGHDLDQTSGALTLDVAQGDEHYVRFNGREQQLKPKDMILKDTQGVICSVIYGLDRRTVIRPETRRVLFVVYAPEGIGAQAVRTHLEDIRDNALLIAPGAEVDEMHVIAALT